MNPPVDPHFAYVDGLPVNKCACGHHANHHLSRHIDGDKWGVACTECNCTEYRPIDRLMRKSSASGKAQ